MSNGEVKRFKFINGVGNWSHEEAVLASDHERVVAEHTEVLVKRDNHIGELQAELFAVNHKLDKHRAANKMHERIVAELRAEVKANSDAGCGAALTTFDQGFEIIRLKETIAKQARVIEKLKEELIDVYEGHRFDVDEMLERVAAIERGEA